MESSPSVTALSMFTATSRSPGRYGHRRRRQRSSVPAAAVTTNSTAITPTPPARQERDQAEPEAEHLIAAASPTSPTSSRSARSTASPEKVEATTTDPKAKRIGCSRREGPQ